MFPYHYVIETWAKPQSYSPSSHGLDYYEMSFLVMKTKTCCDVAEDAISSPGPFPSSQRKGPGNGVAEDG